MKTHLLCVIFAMTAYLSSQCFAQTAGDKTAPGVESDQCELAASTTYAKDCAAAAKLKAALKVDDRQAVAVLIEYPLQRDLPLHPIANSKEFLKHWDEYFDAVTTKEIIDQKPEQYGWRGIALANGMLWFNNGRVISINSEAAAYKQALEDAKHVETVALYPDAQGYDRIEQQCNTKTLHVRVQRHGEGLRYFAWKRGAPFSSRPELELKDGTAEESGSDGHAVLTFKNAGFTYQLDNGLGICGEDCHSYLTVLKDGKQVARQVCTASSK